MFQRYFLAPLAALLLAAAPRLAQAQTGGVGIGTTAPDASAALDVSSTSKGLLPPRMTQAQRNAIASPATGLTIYNSTSNKLNTWNGTSWDASLSATEQPLQFPSQTFNYTGRPQTYTVPPGVQSISVDVVGGQGGRAYYSSSPGGYSGRVQATLAVTPGEVLTLYVGGAGLRGNSYFSVSTGGYNGGGNGYLAAGGGGGASDIRRGAATLTDRIVTAGGGGGGGNQNNANGGDGGSSSYGSGSNGSGNAYGQGGYTYYGGQGGYGGGGGTIGGNGALGQGGNGSGSGSSASYSAAQGGGGGGGGYYGGGGGGTLNPASYPTTGGGGGGGSSYVVAAGASAINITYNSQSSNGYIAITAGAQYAAPTLDGTNFLNVPGTWQVSGSDVYRSSGNVGIGTNTPGQKLDVRGNSTVTGTALVSGTMGIGPNSPAASAQLDVNTDPNAPKGFLPPCLTTTQRNAIGSPAAGLTIYNTTTNRQNIWNGTSWSEDLPSSETPGVAPTAVTLSFTGAAQTYTVPGGVLSLGVDARGAAGGSSLDANGGPGGRVQTTLSVTPGEVLTIYVGGAGSRAPINGRGGGGYNGGADGEGSQFDSGDGASGGGGGATDIRRGGTGLTNRVLVAGGGGGAGISIFSINTIPGTDGGSGGGLSGGAGGGNYGGSGGTQTGGGPFGQGQSASRKAGGGGGYYGGAVGSYKAGGSGGGSGYVIASSSGTTFTNGENGGNGSITLTPGGTYAAAPALNGANIVNIPGTWNVSGAGVYRYGNVGIGTSAPTQPLEVAGQVYSSTGGFRFPDNSVQTKALSAASLIQNSTSQQAGASFSIDGTGTVGGALTAGSTTITGNATMGTASIAGDAIVGGHLGMGVSSPVGQLSNTSSNIIATDGNGISAQGLGWINTSAVGYAGMFYNASNAANSPGLAVKVASASAAAFDVSQGSPAGTAGTSLLRVQGSGNVGIGTSSPQAGLHIDRPETTTTTSLGILLSGGSTGNPSIELRGNGKTPYIDFVENTGLDYSTRLISQAGTLSLQYGGTTTKPSYLFNVQGGIQATAVNNTSDQRLKQDVRPLGGALASVLALRGVRYEWNALGVQHGGTAGAGQVGVIAQEVEKVYPELVSTGSDGYKAVNYAQLTPVLIEAIKEQQAQIEALKAQVATQAGDHASLLTLQAQMARLLGEQPTAAQQAAGK